MWRWMMWVVLLGWVSQSQAQTFDEWFEQNSTRKKYQFEQIGEYQVYLTVLQDGYGIVESGLDTIQGIKAGEYNLHNNYYTSLRTVSPVVTSMPEVGEIVSLQTAMVNRFSSALMGYQGSPGLWPNELVYLTGLYGAVVQEGLADVTLLGQILTDGTLGMSDNERIRGVLAIDHRARERYRATVGVTDAADVMVIQRTGRASDGGTVSKLYGLP